VPTNTRMLSAFRAHLGERWFRSLRRRSQRHRLPWERMSRLIDRFVPPVRLQHPWPDQRFSVTPSPRNGERFDPKLPFAARETSAACDRGGLRGAIHARDWGLIQLRGKLS